MDETKTKIKKRYPLLILIVIFILWGFSWFLISEIFPMTERGVFGDSYGAVNSLFSGLALFGVIYAILLQKIELKLQRKELKHTTEELKGQKEELKIQNETNKLQRFENTYFNLMNYIKSEIESLEITPAGQDGNIRKGSKALLYLGQIHKKIFDRYKTRSTPQNQRFVFEIIYQKYGYYFNKLFLNLFNLVNFIQKSEFKKNNLYITLIISELNLFTLLYLHYLHIKTSDDKVLNERYSFLIKHIANLDENFKTQRLLKTESDIRDFINYKPDPIPIKQMITTYL